jgi:hypothetical protein
VLENLELKDYLGGLTAQELAVFRFP